MSKIDFFDSLIYILLGCLVFFYAKNNTAEFTAVSPAFFPRMIASVLIFVNILRLTLLIYNRDGNQYHLKNINKADIISFVFVILSLFTYYFLNYLIGFTSSTILFIFCLCYLLGEKKVIQNLIFAFVISGVITSIFKWILVLPLPQGIFF